MLLQVLNAILSDLMSRIWMTYRRGFPAIGEAMPACVLTSLSICSCIPNAMHCDFAEMLTLLSRQLWHHKRCGLGLYPAQRADAAGAGEASRIACKIYQSGAFSHEAGAQGSVHKMLQQSPVSV